jgi:hypothetical protein
VSATVQLNESSPITLDASGNGTAKIGPTSHGEAWNPVTTSVKCSTSVQEAACKIYAGDSPIDRNFVDATLSGSTGDRTGSISGPIRMPNSIFAVWSGGDVGATATIRVVGTKDIQ